MKDNINSDRIFMFKIGKTDVLITSVSATLETEKYKIDKATYLHTNTKYKFTLN